MEYRCERCGKEIGYMEWECEDCAKSRKLREAIQACIDGEFHETDFNGQECGWVDLPGRTLPEARKGDVFEVEASPNSCRECASGKYILKILDRRENNGFVDFAIEVIDEMGNIGDYPNFEWYQNYDCSGTYIVRLLANRQFKVNPKQAFDIEKVRRRCRDLLNKTQDPKAILEVAGILNAKIW